jgi:hypothetical protein
MLFHAIIHTYTHIHTHSGTHKQEEMQKKKEKKKNTHRTPKTRHQCIPSQFQLFILQNGAHSISVFALSTDVFGEKGINVIHNGKVLIESAQTFQMQPER